MDGLYEWSIPSNRGWNALAFVDGVFSSEHMAIEFTVQLTGSNWKESCLLADPPVFHLANEFLINLTGVLVTVNACKSLLMTFDKWLAERKSFAYTLVSGPTKRISLEVSPQNGTISSGDDDKPALVVTYVGGCDLTLSYIVDQTCIRLAADSLRRIVAALGTSAHEAGERKGAESGGLSYEFVKKVGE